jgi:hypothetical protein
MRYLILATLAVTAAVPGGADVKAGVDAWARADFDRAVEEWRGPAIAGDADAQFNLGQAYKLGRGVPVDPTLAASWFRKAALQGHEQAETNYGIALFESDRKSEAAPWLEKSVARFEPRGMLVLGTMLFNGDGIKRDYPRAYALMTRASAAGLTSASRTLADMDAYISPADRERGVALSRQYETQAKLLPPTAPTRMAMRVGEAGTSPVPASVPARGTPVRTTAVPPSRPPREAGVPRTSAPQAQPSLLTGGWRIQLGAFRDRGNAEALWRRVGPRLRGASPDYVASNGVTRLQVGAYASTKEAANACAAAKAAGAQCVVIAR